MVGCDAEILGKLTCGANISTITRGADGTRLGLGWRIVLRRSTVRRRRRRRWGFLLKDLRGRVGDLWGGG